MKDAALATLTASKKAMSPKITDLRILPLPPLADFKIDSRNDEKEPKRLSGKRDSSRIDNVTARLPVPLNLDGPGNFLRVLIEGA
jgi:hypothetical protein